MYDANKDEGLQRERQLNQRCQEAIEPILRGSGYEARIVFYPTDGDGVYWLPWYKRVWRKMFAEGHHNKTLHDIVAAELPEQDELSNEDT